MESVKLFESELRIMAYIWEHDNPPAKDIAAHCLKTYAWTKNTTYSILNKLVAKAYIERREPNFLCVPLIERKNARLDEAKSVVGRFFDGSYKLLFAELLAAKAISPEELKELKDMIERS